MVILVFYILDKFDSLDIRQIADDENSLNIKISVVSKEELFKVIDNNMVDSQITNVDILNIINASVANQIDCFKGHYTLSALDTIYVCKLEDNNLIIHKIETIFE